MTSKRSPAERAPHYPRCQHRAYHLTCEQQEDLLARGGHMCHACQAPSRYNLVLDHDHNLGWRAVRGLLCPSCNALMRQIDAGRRAPDERFMRYLGDPWHAQAGIMQLGCPDDCRWGSHKGTNRWRVGR